MKRARWLFASKGELIAQFGVTGAIVGLLYFFNNRSSISVLVIFLAVAVLASMLIIIFAGLFGRQRTVKMDPKSERLSSDTQEHQDG